MNIYYGENTWAKYKLTKFNQCLPKTKYCFFTYKQWSQHIIYSSSCSKPLKRKQNSIHINHNIKKGDFRIKVIQNKA